MAACTHSNGSKEIGAKFVILLAKGEGNMALQLQVEGSQEKVRAFDESLKSLPEWRFYNRFLTSIGENELRMDYLLDEKPYAKPSLPARKVSKLFITGENGEQVEIVLLDAQVVDMDNATYIHGKSYDIFAVGEKDESGNKV